jgi:hypothetical protein
LARGVHARCRLVTQRRPLLAAPAGQPRAGAAYVSRRVKPRGLWSVRKYALDAVVRAQSVGTPKVCNCLAVQPEDTISKPESAGIRSLLNISPELFRSAGIYVPLSTSLDDMTMDGTSGAGARVTDHIGR